MKKISVIVPIYNIKAYLDQCVQSILAQTYQNLEVILVDDGSNDGSGEICDSYIDTDERVKVIHTENGGLVVARKNGLKAASGDYIGFVDGDDYLAPEMYESLVSVIESGEYDFVHSGYYVSKTKRTMTPEDFGFASNSKRIEFLKQRVFSSDYSSVITPSIWSKLFRTDFIKEQYGLVPDGQNFGEDLLCLCHCILHCSRFCTLDQAHYYYRIREGSITHEYKKLFSQNMELYRCLCSILEREGVMESLKFALDSFFSDGIIGIIRDNGKDPFALQRYQYPEIRDLYEKRIVLYGAGAVGRSYYSQFCRYGNISISAWVDNDPSRFQYDCYKIESLEIIKRIGFDFIVIAVLNKEASDDILKNLMAS